MKKLLLACAALTLATTACFVDPPATPPTGGNWATCPTAAVGQVQVAIVTEGVPNPAYEVVCVVVPDGANGFDALNARAARLGTTPLRFNGAFLCAIDNAPLPPTCGTDPAGPLGFSYWSYWDGGSAWSEYSVGAADVELHQGDVEGWKYGTWDFATTFPTAPAHSASFATLTS